jgi:hypothetical protein
MSPEAFSIIEKLSTMGGQAGILFAAVYYLARTLKTQYDSRIESLERRSSECEKDRIAMHGEIRAMQTSQLSQQGERIHSLEALLRDRKG